MTQNNTIAQSNNFIILNEYKKIEQKSNSYQTEGDLEKEFIKDLELQGYEHRKDLRTEEKLLRNVKVQLERLNNVEFSEDEWERFCREYLNKPSATILDQTRKIHEDYIYDFVFDDGQIKNIYLLDKKVLSNNKLEVVSQYTNKGKYVNRYDVTILVNGLPLVQVELKKRGVAIKEAFNQVNRYTKESFNGENSLFKYLQIFVISNGTDSRYFANTTKRDKNSFNFTMNWARANNEAIKDLKDFTATFFSKNTLIRVLVEYSVFDASDTLLIMRPYQIAATERIIDKINIANKSKLWNELESSGYIWHTTGSGKTLTSFKAARLATKLDFIDKVFFVVDRKDLDFQTMKEYQKFSPDSVNGSNSTRELKNNIEKDDNKIVVTTIQKLNNLMKKEKDLEIYNKKVVLIFDEAHRSQFGEAQDNIKKTFKKYCQFGFTGTPIFSENACDSKTTGDVFGNQLHSYVITDAIRDEKVLKFKIDYNDVCPKFKKEETEQDDKKLMLEKTKKALLHPERIKEVSRYIVDNFKVKTHRLYGKDKGFNAMFAVSSVTAAKLYYEELQKLQEGEENPLNIATIYSYSVNEDQLRSGEISDEDFSPTAMDSSAKEFLTSVINDYNKTFETNFGVEDSKFQNYYKDLAKRVKTKEVDLLIVVGMFLTGFDAPTLNTLFVDKNLRYHGLIQAFSRTNRILNSTKQFGNIVTFRNLEDATEKAITLFGKGNERHIIIEKSYKEYMEGFLDIINEKEVKGYIEIVNELETQFPEVDKIEKDGQKREFAKLFGEYLKVENILQNYDEFTALKNLQQIDKEDPEALEQFKKSHHLDDEEIEYIKHIKMLDDRTVQNYRSTYNDIREWRKKEGEKNDGTDIEEVDEWDDIVFEVELLKSQEIGLDFILELIFDKNKNTKDKESLIEEISSVVSANTSSREKESLVVDFINQTDLNKMKNAPDTIEEFHNFAQEEKMKEIDILIEENNLNEQLTKEYIKKSLRDGKPNSNGEELKNILPKMSPLNPKYTKMKKEVFEKIEFFVKKFRDVGSN